MYYLIDKYAPFPPNEGPPRLMPSDWDILPQERDHAQKATKPAVVHDGFLSPKYRWGSFYLLMVYPQC